MSLTPAEISWRDGQPYAEDYADIYFSRDGMDEVERVFLAPTGLPQRAKELLTVGELGFGTGLNFAVCASRVLQQTSARLHFISFEKHPLSAADWRRVATHYAAALPIYGELVATPLPVLAGWQQRVVAGGRVTLSVYHGEVADGLAQLAEQQHVGIDAWFLDGFAPTANPDMWTAQVFDLVARCAAPGCRAATFTAAGAVRRNLERVGFAVHKVDQRPHKRESLCGVLETGKPTPAAPSQVRVYGAGIGGACVARHLADQNVTVTVYDPAGIAAGASGIPCAVLHARLLGDGSPAAAWRAAAFHYASAYLYGRRGVQRSGALQLQGANLNAAKMARIGAVYEAGAPHQEFWLQMLAAEPASRLAGLLIAGTCLYFPTAGTVNLPALCADLLDHQGIEVRQETGPQDTDLPTVLCNGSASRTWCDWLEVADIHGQLDHFAGEIAAQLPIVGNGYLVPRDGGCTLGATYEYQPWTGEQAVAHNLAQNAHLVDTAPLRHTGSSRGPRAVTSDRLPMIGRLDENLWIASGYGSMGTTAAPLAAAMVAAELLGWAAPLDTTLVKALQPQRFRERQARRGVRHR